MGTHPIFESDFDCLTECKMGCLQSKPAPEKEIDSGPKVYSWDKRAKSPESTKAKFFIRERIGLENAIHRNDVKDAPITIDACRDTIIFLEGQIKNLIIDECTNVAVVAFVQDSTYIRNSVNCHVILVTGQLRTRDCRQLRLCLHCPTQPVIESTTKVTVSPVKMDFVGVENIAMKHSKFNNQWHKIHDFGPVGDEPNWVTSNTDDHLAELFTKMALHLPLAPKLKCDGGSFYPITMGVSSNSSESGELSESKLVFFCLAASTRNIWPLSSISTLSCIRVEHGSSVAAVVPTHPSHYPSGRANSCP